MSDQLLPIEELDEKHATARCGKHWLYRRLFDDLAFQHWPAVSAELRRLREENERLKANRSTLAPTWTPRDYDDPCTCLRCLRERDVRDPNTGWPITSMRMFGCPTCGNKRCPHGGDHRFKCTGSNEPNQVGELIDEHRPEIQLTQPAYFQDDEVCGYCGRQPGQPHANRCRQ